MYDNLMRELQCCPDGEYGCSRCEHRTSLHCRETLMKQAADAIEQLQKDLERSKEYEAFWEEEANEALRRFQVAIASKPRWIPVSERLPEDMWCNVLVTDGENVGMGWLDYYTRKDTGAVERDWFAPNTPVEENKITHWMPLPMPPKEET